jgi:hypothetical protein
VNVVDGLALGQLFLGLYEKVEVKCPDFEAVDQKSHHLGKKQVGILDFPAGLVR